MDAACADAVCSAVHAAWGEGADLVTGDAAADYEHDRLEEEHITLLCAEVHLGLRCLAPNGTLVVKFFEGSTYETRFVLAQLSARFSYMSIVKPSGSRPTNSERYVIARGFQGDASPVVSTGFVSPLWDHDVVKIFDRLADDQSCAIERALACYQKSVKEGERCE